MITPKQAQELKSRLASYQAAVNRLGASVPIPVHDPDVLKNKKKSVRTSWGRLQDFINEITGAPE